MTPRASHARPRSRPAFSLIEMVMALAITSLLLAGVGAAISASIRPADAGSDANAAATEAADALSRVSAELATATSVTSYTPSAISFTVPDRNADGAPETITYAWSGVAGAPLTRSYNGSAAGAIISDVRSLTLGGQDRPAAVPVESATITLASCDQPLGSTLRLAVLDDTEVAAAYVRPALPASAVSWKVTGLQVVLSAASSGKSMKVEITDATSALQPGSTVYASYTHGGGSLPTSAAWVSTPITVSGLTPGQGVCITIKKSSGSGSTQYAGYVTGNNLPLNTHFIYKGGGSWSAPSDQSDLRFILTGTYTTMVEP